MKLTKEDLTYINSKLTDLDLTFIPFGETIFDPVIKTINFDFPELDDIPNWQKEKRGHNIEEFYLMVLLHEIGHYKHLLKHKCIADYVFHYKQKTWKYEELADRFARRYYKKVLQAYLNERG